MTESEIRRRIRWCLLPYGKWKCEDGREVLFNRRYRPIWQKTSDSVVSVADPDEWVSFMATEHFYNDGTNDKAGAGVQAFEKFTGQVWDWDDAESKMPFIDKRLAKSLMAP